MLNEALGLVALEDFATMVLPIQPVQPWQTPNDLKEGEVRIAPGEEWRRYVRDDVSTFRVSGPLSFVSRKHAPMDLTYMLPPLRLQIRTRLPRLMPRQRTRRYEPFTCKAREQNYGTRRTEALVKRPH